MIDYNLNEEMLGILEKINKKMEIEYQGDFINGDYMFNVSFVDYEYYWEDVTIKKNSCVNESDAYIYLIVTKFIDYINICKEYKGIYNDGIDSLNKWFITIGHEDANNFEELKEIIDEDCDIYGEFLEGLDKANFARNTLSKEELFKFGDFVKNSPRYKRIVNSKVSAMNRKLEKAKLKS